MTVIDEIAAERRRQIDQEGWSVDHDDAHDCGQMAAAAAAYANHASMPDAGRANFPGSPVDWPWHDEWWKPTNRRRDLIKAGALIVAEIERLDRDAAKTPEERAK